jgi:hypothetical protein
MDDYDDEQPSVPTFSEGSISGRRGANSRAAASRAFASKSAISIASKASAIIAASIQNSSTTIIKQPTRTLINQHQTPALNTRQFNPIQHLGVPQNSGVKFPQITNPIPLSQPHIVSQLAETPKLDIMSSINNFIEERTTSISSKKELDYNNSIEEKVRYRNAIHVARRRKLQLLPKTEPLIIKERSQYKPVKYILHKSLIGDTDINHEVSEEFIDNLRTSVATMNKEAILDHINKYQISLRISIEEPIHKRAFQDALINKTAYLTSDT